MAATLLAGDPLTSLFPRDEVRDVAGLDLRVHPGTTAASKPEPGRYYRRVEIEFTSFEWAGEKWRHKATLLIPDRIPEQYCGAGVILSEPAVFEKADPGWRYAELAVLMGIPALLVGDENSGRRFGIQGDGNLMGHAQKMFLKTGDPRWIGYAWLAKIMVRAATAFQAAKQVPVDRFVITGGSKRGEASWIAAAVDDRIAGAYPTSWNAGNMEKWLALKAERWGMDHAARQNTIAPASVSTRTQMEQLLGPRGREYHRQRLQGKTYPLHGGDKRSSVPGGE